MAEEIIIDISPTGETEIKVQGCPGPSCKDLTKGLEKALGKTVSDKKSQEYYKQVETEKQQLGRK